MSTKFRTRYAARPSNRNPQDARCEAAHSRVGEIALEHSGPLATLADWTDRSRAAVTAMRLEFNPGVSSKVMAV